MASAFTATASGQGSLVINSGAIQRILEFDAQVITLATNARAFGPSGMRRVYQQGWVGLGATFSTGNSSNFFFISWSHYIADETFYWLLQPFGQPEADTIYWDLEPGAVMFFEAYW